MSIKSGITKNSCLICGRSAEAEHHLIFGNGRRNKCDEYSYLKIPLCNECHTMGRYRIHDNPTAETLSKMLGQALWEKEHIQTYEDVREGFIEEFGRSWL